jgi:hypothetical protein
MEKLFSSLLDKLEDISNNQDSLGELFGSISLDSSPKKGIFKPKNI